jgi:signal transduction histidine kinase
LAAEHYDALSQLAFSVALNTDWCVRRCPPRSPLTFQLEEIRWKTGAMMERIRRLIAELSIDSGPASGLLGRLAVLLRQFRETTRVPAELVRTGDVVRLGPAGQERLYTWLQEIFALLARRACRLLGVALRLASDGDLVRFEITVRVAAAATGHVVAKLRGDEEFSSLRTRIATRGGQLSLQRTRGTGLRLVGSVPITDVES